MQLLAFKTGIIGMYLIESRWDSLVPPEKGESKLVSTLERRLRDGEMLDRKSRMKREFRVRFCERPKGRSLWPTRPFAPLKLGVGLDKIPN